MSPDELAQQLGYDFARKTRRKYKDFSIYMPEVNSGMPYPEIGRGPYMILSNNQETRWATKTECEEIRERKQ